MNSAPETPEFTVPLADRHFEDYVPGTVSTYGPITVTEAEIVAFARAFDPQQMHTDPAASVDGPFGGLIASGWHTTAIMMRLMADNYLNQWTSLASPGVDELRWHLPVRPGDALSARFTVLDARPSRTKPDRGLVRTRIELLRQDGAVVMSQMMMNLIRSRSTAAPTD
ncbi:MaoC family dehydratase [Curtobacterium sp. ISL-83]|uniref:MaoC family dehydratase n=1 Tax=Curtobacterium sp. ISL-83 TaxID=2819145 RepID=UPI001BE9F427|nr:MaoC family dehydratase [Curtobacterium sp. ISL-83]MBT2502117.1 MaoC family dehydratase [Curtobacterium sp. ISL-83]